VPASSVFGAARHPWPALADLERQEAHQARGTALLLCSRRVHLAVTSERLASAESDTLTAPSESQSGSPSMRRGVPGPPQTQQSQRER
jgi:hypothetical protein